MKYKIYNDNVIEWSKSYNKIKFHAMLCDPPYHLQSIVERFGKENSAPAKHGTDGVFQRASSGFMGQKWDGGDIAFDPKTWALLGKHLYPGAFGMAFAASRNWHRLAVAIEDAGFIIHPTIFLWAQGQGFPKATNIDKQIDKRAEKKREVIETIPDRWTQKGSTYNFSTDRPQGNVNITAPATDLAKAWEGHRYGLQALKPSVEPIIVFQKKYEGKPLDNIIETGAGALNIDAARIPLVSEDDEYVINTFDDGAKPWGDAKGEKYTSRKITTGAGKGKIGNTYGWSNTERKGGQWEGSEQGRWPANFMLTEETAQQLDGQGGGASRFFYTVSNKLDQSDPVYYCPKASPKEKSAGLEERSNHPTHKPLDLCRYLASLLLPPDMYENRSILVPFSGVGSEMIGAGLAGWDRAVGIEMDTEQGYIDIARKRLEYWLNENSST